MDNKNILQILKSFSELNIEELNLKLDNMELSLKKSKPLNIVNNSLSTNNVDTNLKNLDVLSSNEIDQLLNTLTKKNNPVSQNAKGGNNLNSNETKQNQNNVANNNDKNNDKNIEIVTSPIVGTFYEAPAPGKPPFVKVGDKVSKGQVLCIIEAMKVMNKIESEIEGEIVEKLVKNEQPVEFGTPLFKIKV